MICLNSCNKGTQVAHRWTHCHCSRCHFLWICCLSCYHYPRYDESRGIDSLHSIRREVRELAGTSGFGKGQICWSVFHYWELGIMASIYLLFFWVYAFTTSESTRMGACLVITNRKASVGFQACLMLSLYLDWKRKDLGIFCTMYPVWIIASSCSASKTNKSWTTLEYESFFTRTVKACVRTIVLLFGT